MVEKLGWIVTNSTSQKSFPGARSQMPSLTLLRKAAPTRKLSRELVYAQPDQPDVASLLNSHVSPLFITTPLADTPSLHMNHNVCAVIECHGPGIFSCPDVSQGTKFTIQHPEVLCPRSSPQSISERLSGVCRDV